MKSQLAKIKIKTFFKTEVLVAEKWMRYKLAPAA